jgi:hypothetical protein
VSEHVHECTFPSHKGKEDRGCTCACGAILHVLGWQKPNILPTPDRVVGGIYDDDPFSPEITSYIWTGTKKIPIDGRPLSRDEFPELFRVIANKYGGDEEAGTFNVPDLRGRVVDAAKANSRETAVPVNNPCAVVVEEYSRIIWKWETGS